MGGRGNAASTRAGASGISSGRIDMGTVLVNGKPSPLTGKLIVKWQNGERMQIDIEIGAKGFLGGNAFGGVTFNVDAANKTATIVSINSMQAFRGQNVGQRLYAQAMLAAQQRGVNEFRSDKRVSLPAARAWRQLGKNLGVSVTERSSTNDGQQLISSGSVFSIDLRKVARSKLEKIGR